MKCHQTLYGVFIGCNGGRQVLLDQRMVALYGQTDSLSCLVDGRQTLVNSFYSSVPGRRKRVILSEFGHT